MKTADIWSEHVEWIRSLSVFLGCQLRLVEGSESLEANAASATLKGVVGPPHPGIIIELVVKLLTTRKDGGDVAVWALVFFFVDKRRVAEQGKCYLSLRNPLNAIRLSADVLLHSDCVVDKHLKSVRRILSSAERMGRIISDLLDFTRGRLGGGIPITPQPINLRHLCRQVLEELEASHPGRELRLEAPGNFLGEWDPDRFAQVMGNLCKNALDYSPENSPVDVVLHDEGDTVCLEVHNPGAPIPPDQLPHIFDPFRQATTSRRHPAPGLGLGLFIVQQIVHAHGGAVTVRSTAADGTTFTVRLPRTKGPAGVTRAEG